MTPTTEFEKVSYQDHSRRVREGGLVYPVISRRSGGLSVGVNLFPDRKTCSFDCPYCEVFPFASDSVFSLADLESDLEEFFGLVYPSSWKSFPVKDICVSGNGEPTLSPFLEACLDLLAAMRRRHESLLARAKIVIITNSTGFSDPGISGMLRSFAAREQLTVWAKLDAGTEELFATMSGSGLDFGRVVAGIRDFSATTPVTIQTMLCRVEGRVPDESMLSAYAGLLSSFLLAGSMIEEIHLYTAARQSCHPGVGALSDSALTKAAGFIRSRLPSGLPLRTFGRSGELA